MKKCLVLIILITILVTTVTGVQAASSFKDVGDTDWFNKDLKYILSDKRNIIAGYPDGTFKPGQKLTVEQFITMVIRASGFDPKAAKGEKWSKPFIDKAVELRYIKATDFYDYGASITRGEMARIVVNAVTNITGAYTYRDAEKIKTFIVDYEKIGNGFKDAVVKAYDVGVIGGYPDGTFGADRVLTRAEATAVMRRLIDVSARKVVSVEGIRADVYKVNADIPGELYDYPMRVRESDGDFATNKWMIERFGFEQVKDFMDIGKGYVENFYNVDYKTINQDAFKRKAQWYFMPKTGWMADDRIDRPIEEHFSYWVDMVKQKEIQIDMNYETDPSLVYSNGDYIIRGMATFTVKSCNDIVWLSNYTRFGKEIEVGKTYSRIVEIEIVNMAGNKGWDHADFVVWNEYFVTNAKEE